MARHMVIWDWYWRMALESVLTETWLKKRDLPNSRLHAEVFVNVTHATGDRTWHALAWEANARVAIAEKQLQDAQDCIAKAVATVEYFGVPLAAWRVHATAAELHSIDGEHQASATPSRTQPDNYRQAGEFTGRTSATVIPVRVVRQ